MTYSYDENGSVSTVDVNNSNNTNYASVTQEYTWKDLYFYAYED